MNTHLHTAESVVDIATGRISRLATTVGLNSSEFPMVPILAGKIGSGHPTGKGLDSCAPMRLPPFKTPQTPRAIRPANAWIYGKSETSEDCLGPMFSHLHRVDRQSARTSSGCTAADSCSV